MFFLLILFIIFHVLRFCCSFCFTPFQCEPKATRSEKEWSNFALRISARYGTDEHTHTQPQNWTNGIEVLNWSFFCLFSLHLLIHFRSIFGFVRLNASHAFTFLSFHSTVCECLREQSSQSQRPVWIWSTLKRVFLLLPSFVLFSVIVLWRSFNAIDSSVDRSVKQWQCFSNSSTNNFRERKKKWR